jgi:PAS domain S-box-containing protein
MQDMEGHRPWETMFSDEGEKARTEYLESIAAGEEHPKMRRLLFTNSGEYRTFDIYCSLIHDADGRVRGMRVMSVDVTDALEELEEANRSRMWIKSVLDALPEAVFVTDALGSIVYVNQAMEKLTGWAASEMLSHQLESLPILEVPEESRCKLGFQAALREEVSFEAIISDRAGNPIRAAISSKPMVEADGGPTTGVAIVIRRL